MIWVQLLLWVVSFILTDYFRERLPSQTASGIGDFNIPTATEGRPVPICIGGTVRFEGPNCIWYGDFVAEDRTVTTGVIFTDEETIGFTYFLALQYALFKGPSAGITGVWIGDDRVFDHVLDAGGIPQEFVDVDRDDLFGGEDGGGGFQGRIRLHDGSETQAVSAFLDTRIDPLPAYRGLSYIMVTSLDEAGGANIGESNQLRFIRVELQTFDNLAGSAGHPGLGDSLSLGNDTHFIGPDLNPIVAAWDVWTNTRWGRGFGLSDIDIASFQAAAATVHAEGIGWTNVQDEQTTTGAIQDLIEQHVDGYIGPNPLTGLIEVTLARPDYVVAALPLVIDVGMSANLLEVESWDQGDWSNTKNRIRIRYTSRDKDWKETHAVETAAGNRIIQGRTATSEVRFPGCHTPAVAQIIAAREKRGLSLPLQKGTILVNRSAYEQRPGQVFRLTSGQAQVVDLPVRVTKMSLGDTTRQAIKLSVVEDIFGNEPATVAPTPPSDFVPPVQVVVPMLVADQAAFESPFILMRGNPQPNTVPRITTLARRSPGNAMIEYEVIRRTGNPPAGAYTSTDFVAAGFTSVGILRNNETGPISGQGGFSMQIDPIGAESLDGLIQPYSPSAGNFAGVAVISPGLATEEFVIFDEIVDDLTGIRLENVYRACMDTFWKAHNAGERIWFIWTGGMGMGLETYAQGLGVEMKFLPRSPNDAVLEAAAVALPVVTMDDVTGNRQAKPLLPAQVSFEEGVWPSPVDFEGTVVPQAGGNYVGNRILPLERLWRTQDILWSVQGLDIAGGGLNPSDISAETMDRSVWIHNLDTDPLALRANAVFEVLNQILVTGGDETQIPKATLVSGGATGIQFNARLEIEMRHSPVGQVGANISHAPGFFDFLATGIFSLEADTVILAAQFNGKDGDQFAIDEHARDILFVGDAQIDTASSIYGDGSLILDGTGDFVHLPSGLGFNWYTGEWTIDFRIRFDDVVSAQVIIGQAWIAPGRTWYLEWDGNSFEFRFSRSGSDGPFTNIPLGAFTPTITTWYTLRIVQAKDPSSPRFSLYIDGTRIGSTFTAQSNTNSGHDWIIGARHDGGNVYTAPFTGQIDNLEVRTFAALDPNATSYVVNTNRPSLGPVAIADPLIAQFEDLDLATDNKTDDSNRWELTFGATSEIDTAQFMFGTSSLRCDGVNSLTPASADGVWLPETLFPADPDPRWNIGTKDFTMEGFLRFVSLPSGTTDGMAIVSKYNRPSGNTVDWMFFVDGNDDLAFYYSPTGNISGGVQVQIDIGVLSTGVWYHFAAQRVGDNLELLFDGNRVLETIDHFIGNRLFNDTSNPVAIGRIYDANATTRIRAMNGWIDGVRVRVGSNLYSGATYTVPTLPAAAGDQGDQDLLLLHHFDGSDFFATDRLQETDDGQRSTRITFISGGRYLDFAPKFGIAHGDAGTLDGFGFTESKFYWALADSDFTIDIWFRNNDTEAQQTNNGVAFFNHWLESGDNRGWRFSFDKATSRLEFIWTTDGTTVDERTAFVSSFNYDATFQDNATYVHVAVERDSGVINIYLDGVIQTLDGASDIIGSDVIFNVAQRAIQVGIEDEASGDKTANGYWDEFRITKRAVYGSASFTPEVAPYTAPVAPNV